MENEALYLPRITRTREHKAQVPAITSGKGAVGKTSIAANLGVCLAASHKKVLLVDADMSLGNLDLLMNIAGKYNISHVLSGQKCIEEIIEIGPAGTEIARGGSGLERPAEINEFQRQRLLTDLAGLQHDTDAIIIDTGAGISRLVVSFCLAAGHVLVVTTPEATAMTDAYAMIKVLVRKRFAGRISLVVNMAETGAVGKRTYRQTANVARRFLDTPIYDAGVQLTDERLRDAGRKRTPVILGYPKLHIGASSTALAARLGNRLALRTDDSGSLRKVVSRFS